MTCCLTFRALWPWCSLQDPARSLEDTPTLLLSPASQQPAHDHFAPSSVEQTGSGMPCHVCCWNRIAWSHGCCVFVLYMLYVFGLVVGGWWSISYQRWAIIYFCLFWLCFFFFVLWPFSWLGRGHNTCTWAVRAGRDEVRLSPNLITALI